MLRTQSERRSQMHLRRLISTPVFMVRDALCTDNAYGNEITENVIILTLN